MIVNLLEWVKRIHPLMRRYNHQFHSGISIIIGEKILLASLRRARTAASPAAVKEKPVRKVYRVAPDQLY